MVLDPAAGFGRHHLRELHRDPGGRWRSVLGGLRLRWTGGGSAQVTGQGRDRQLSFTLTVPEGAHHDLVLELSDTALDDQAPEADRVWQATETAWREAIPTLGQTIAPRDARHAYAVLRGLTSSGGGMVAAATMSLPERAAQGATTTTSTSGSATSATPGKPWPPTVRTHCSMTPSGSSPSACSTTART